MVANTDSKYLYNGFPHLGEGESRDTSMPTAVVTKLVDKRGFDLLLPIQEIKACNHTEHTSPRRVGSFRKQQEENQRLFCFLRNQSRRGCC